MTWRALFENPRARLTGAALKKKQEKTKRMRARMAAAEKVFQERTKGMTQDQIMQWFGFKTGEEEAASPPTPPGGAYYVRFAKGEVGPYDTLEEAHDWGADLAGRGKYQVVQYGR